MRSMLSLLFDEEDLGMTKEERFKEISSNKADNRVYEYLKTYFDNLIIEIYGKHKGKLMDLMKKGLLEGFCWETTETAILFLDDDTYIERGYLKFEKYKHYYHSWIIFKYKEEEYVFDPCLQILCKKDIYHKVFEIQLKGKVTAKQVREYFINYINNPPKINTSSIEAENFIKEFFGDEIVCEKEKEIIIQDKEDPNAPMYRNGVGYKATIEEGKIKELVAHYYYS